MLPYILPWWRSTPVNTSTSQPTQLDRSGRGTVLTKEVVGSDDGSSAPPPRQGLDGPGGLIRPTAVEMVSRQAGQVPATRNASFAAARHVVTMACSMGSSG